MIVNVDVNVIILIFITTFITITIYILQLLHLVDMLPLQLQ